MAEMTDDIDIYDDDDVDLVRHHREAGRGRDGGCFAFREGERGKKREKNNSLWSTALSIPGHTSQGNSDGDGDKSLDIYADVDQAPSTAVDEAQSAPSAKASAGEHAASEQNGIKQEQQHASAECMSWQHLTCSLSTKHLVSCSFCLCLLVCLLV